MRLLRLLFNRFRIRTTRRYSDGNENIHNYTIFDNREYCWFRPNATEKYREVKANLYYTILKALNMCFIISS